MSLEEFKNSHGSYYKLNNIKDKQITIFILSMETAAILIIFMASLLVGITGYSVYTSFGSASKNLRDPFEEHED